MNFQKLETIQGFKNFLKDFFQGKNVRIYLFGSRAKGSYTERSDIDIAVLSDKDISFELALLREIIENSNLPQTVDVIDLNTVDSEFREQILKEGVLWVKT
jgi:predicted nucleotidyltransferase